MSIKRSLRHVIICQAFNSSTMSCVAAIKIFVTRSSSFRLPSSNEAPVALADAYGVDEDAILTVDVLSSVLLNDTDADADPLTAVLVGENGRAGSPRWRESAPRPWSRRR